MAWKVTTARRRRIIAIRVKALQLVERHGERPRIALGDTLAVRVGPFTVAVMKPVPGLELTNEGLWMLGRWRRRDVTHLRWLHIWLDGGKVVLLRWETPSGDDVKAVQFRRGVWEEQFLGLERIRPVGG